MNLENSINLRIIAKAQDTTANQKSLSSVMKMYLNNLNAESIDIDCYAYYSCTNVKLQF